MERLKEALGQLDVPHCPNCRVATRWFRSELLRDLAQPIIAHLFVCPNCKRAQRTETIFTPAHVPPDKVAAPVFRHRGAA
ncbi:hypothetical protein [Bradyrhizobium centrosematis]|uniref:hypothetical protein n=1 Tax=Bradyrhizobium centrosematis TaxID=1300039 RepID=UPI00388E7C01